jgi:prolyl oligopeptidase
MTMTDHGRSLTALLGLTLTIAAAAAVAQTAPPPAAPVRPVTDDYFSTKVVDNYRYMENLKDPEVQKWMKAQADYTRATLDALPGYAALLKRVAELDASESARVTDVQIVAGRYYSLRTPAGSQSPKLYVREGVNGQDKLLIDPERLSAGSASHLSIHGYRPSPDGQYIAYQLAAGGSEESVLHIFDVAAGKDLPETADRAHGDPFWRADGRSFFYSRRQKLAAGTPATAKFENSRVYLHRLGHSFDDDTPILGRGVGDASIPMRPAEFPEIATVPGSHYAIAFISPGTDQRLRIYAAPKESISDGKAAWRPIAASYDDEFIASHNADFPVIALSGDTLYWLSRKNAPRGEILKLGLARADSKPEVVVPQGDLPISAVYAGRGAIYWLVNDGGVNSIHRLRLTKDAKPETLALHYAGDVADVDTDNASDAVSLLVNSYLRSPAYLDLDAQTGKLTNHGLQPAGPYDSADDLAVDEVKVKSWDGTLVPLSIVHKKGIKLDGSNTAMITGYGAYGNSTSPFYVPAMQGWYDHAQVFAFAHVRGGGEYGEAWHKAGFQETKPNTWKDFIACAQYLLDHKYTNPRKLFGWAQSAGGILIGRAIEERPDLFGAAVIRVPAADMLRFQTTANGPGNIPEFGDVRTEAGFKALYAMSPYAHVEDGVKYPPTLVYAGFNDQRVAAWIPAKFAARLQAATASGKPVLLRVDYDAGHTGFDATRRQSDLNTADMLAFALWQTGDPAFQTKQ